MVTLYIFYLVGPDALSVGQFLALAARRPHEQQVAAHLVHAVANLWRRFGYILNMEPDL